MIVSALTISTANTVNHDDHHEVKLARVTLPVILVISLLVTGGVKRFGSTVDVVFMLCHSAVTLGVY